MTSSDTIETVERAEGDARPARADLQRILSADRPITLAGVPSGFLPWLAADLARAAARRGGRAVFVAPDEAAMRGIVDAAHYFAPELETLSFPAWDCLPYDRSSPSSNEAMWARANWPRRMSFSLLPR